MNTPKSPGPIPAGVLAAVMAESIPDYLRASVALSPKLSAEDLPLLDEADDVRLWCFLEGMLTERQEVEFLRQVTASPALKTHLAWILQNEVTAVPRARPEATSRPADFEVWLSPAGLRSSARGRRQESRSFRMARSDEEATTSFQEVKLLAFGSFRMTIDQLSAMSCQVTIEPETLSVPLSTLTCAWISQGGERVVDQPFTEGFVRFSEIPLGQHDFEIRAGDLTAEAITVRLAEDTGRAD